MKNICFLFIFACLSLFFAQPSDAQCYVRLEDASGFNTDAYQDTLQAAAAKLCAIFDSTGFDGQFKVYDFGFYLHQENTTGGYPEPFAQKMTEVQDSSPYYLLFGKQTDKSGVYTKFWVDLVLPDTGHFQCLDDLDREIFNSKINININSIPLNEATYFIGEINEIDSLYNFVKEQITCCDVQNRRMNGCSLCPTDDDIASYFLNLGAKAFPINIPAPQRPNNISDNKLNGLVLDYSISSSIEISNTQADININITSILEKINESYTVSAFITSNESFCNYNQISEIKNLFNSSNGDINIWFHILRKNKYCDSDLLLLLDRSKYEVSWNSTDEIINDCNHWFTQYSFAGDQPILVSDSIIPKLGFFEGMWYAATERQSFNRAIRFAEEHSITSDNIFFYEIPDNKTLVNKNFVILHSYLQDPTPYEFRHTFIEDKAGCNFSCWFTDCCDSKWETWDLFWDSETGEPILTQEIIDLAEGHITLDLPCSSGAKVGTKAGIYLARQGSNTGKIWVIYTFLNKAGIYVGMTIDFSRRIREHGAKVLGGSLRIFENIPDKLTTRGLEQIMIEDGRLKNLITEQIDSITKKRNLEILEEGVEKAVLFIQQNYSSKLAELQPAIDYLRAFYN